MESAVIIHNDEARAGTFLIAKGFDRDHTKLVRNITRYKSQFEELENNKQSSRQLIIQRVHNKKAGRPVEEYLLNEAQTLFLGTLFRTSPKKPNDPVLRFKVQLAKDFVKMKNLLSSLQNQRQSPEWIENRAAGKIARHEETDTIKDFVEYAKAQGSKNAEKYYVILSQCVNNNMFEFSGKFKNKREAMTATQLLDVGFADKIVGRGLIEGMAESKPYKEIYKLVKDRIITLAGMYGKSEIVSKQLLIDG